MSYRDREREASQVFPEIRICVNTNSGKNCQTDGSTAPVNKNDTIFKNAVLPKGKIGIGPS